MKKKILVGVLFGCLSFSALTAGAAKIEYEGWLYTKNPLTSAPKGQAVTSGYGNLYAKVVVTKNNYKASDYKKYDAGTGGALISTSWVSGPTYSSSDTSFASEHRGYTSKGKYKVTYASKEY